MATAETQESRAAVTRASEETMFKWSGFVHVGPGAEECPDDGVGCSDRSHFHAWVRLPNQYVHRDIAEKADAARARKIRQLKDPECDAYALLDLAVFELRQQAESWRPAPDTENPLNETVEAIIDELMSEDHNQDMLDVLTEVDDREEFERINQDQERYRTILDMPEEEQPADERDELGRHIQAYVDTIQAELTRVQEPRRDALRDTPLEGLLERLRDKRIDQDGYEERLHVYNTWMWWACTFAPEVNETVGRPTTRRWPDIDAMKEEASEVLGEIQMAFHDLELAQQRAVPNS